MKHSESIPFSNLALAIAFPDNRLVRDPFLHALPEGVFGEVWRQSAHDGFESFALRASAAATTLLRFLVLLSRLTFRAGWGVLLGGFGRC